MPKSIDAVQSKLQQYESLAITQTINMKSPGGQKPGEAGIQDVAMLSSAHHQGGKQRKGPSSAVQQSHPQNSQGKSSKRQPLSEEEAIKLGLKKLPCCGKYGSHNPEDGCSGSISSLLARSHWHGSGCQEG